MCYTVTPPWLLLHGSQDIAGHGRRTTLQEQDTTEQDMDAGPLSTTGIDTQSRTVGRNSSEPQDIQVSLDLDCKTDHDPMY